MLIIACQQKGTCTSAPALLELCTTVSLALCALSWKKNDLTPVQKKEIGVRKVGVVSLLNLIFGGSEPESVLLYGPKGTPFAENQRNFCLHMVERKGRRFSCFSICYIL